MFIRAIAASCQKRDQPSRPGLTRVNPTTARTVSTQLQSIAGKFSGGEAILKLTALGHGLINETYLVNTSLRAFVLQRINRRVFPEPALIMANLQQLDSHLQQIPNKQLQIPSIILSNSGQPLFVDEEQQVWRALELITASESREKLTRISEAEQVGHALGHFHRLCSNLPSEKMHDTLPGFHITPVYYAQYQSLLPIASHYSQQADVIFCQHYVQKFQPQIAVLENARQQGLLFERVIHGDPKLNNFLFKPGTDQIVSLIDLDTVKPGLVHYDIGDCLRSCCHDAHDNRFDLNICSSVLSAYLGEAGEFFTPTDYEFLYTAILLIPFELGLRFFSDYLSGNIYFKAKDAEENLRRAVALFQLCDSICQQQNEIEKLISKGKERTMAFAGQRK